MTETSTATATGTGRTGITRPVLLAGIALGTTLTILAMWNGVRLRVPGIPPVIGAALGTVIVWALFMAVAAVLSELTVRHHRAALGHGWRHGKRGGHAAAGWSRRAARGAAVRSRPWRTRLVTAMQTRWAARGAPATPEPEDPAGGSERICPGCGWAIPAGGTCPACKAGREAGPPDPGTGPTYSWGPAAGPSGWPADDPETAHRWAQHMSTGGKAYVVTGYPPGGGPGRTVATYVNGKPVQPSTEGNPMTDPGTGRHTRRPGGSAGDGGCSPAWKTLAAETARFRAGGRRRPHELDGRRGHRHERLRRGDHRRVRGVSARIGLDPVSLAALHDYADAAAEAAQAMAAARQKFASHYQEVREFAAAGGLLPHDGRWITGEGD